MARRRNTYLTALWARAKYSKVGMVVGVVQLLACSFDSSKNLLLNNRANLLAKRGLSAICCDMSLKEMEVVN